MTSDTITRVDASERLTRWYLDSCNGLRDKAGSDDIHFGIPLVFTSIFTWISTLTAIRTSKFTSDAHSDIYIKPAKAAREDRSSTRASSGFPVSLGSARDSSSSSALKLLGALMKRPSMNPPRPRTGGFVFSDGNPARCISHSVKAGMVTIGAL